MARVEGDRQIHQVQHSCGHPGEVGVPAWWTWRQKQAAVSKAALRPCDECKKKGV